MSLTEDQLAEVVDDLLETFVGLPVVPSEPTDGPLPVTAFVQITGGWTGTVLVSCTDQLASIVAAAMLDAALDVLDPDDVSDALGEVANMVGGSVKSLMPEAAALSLPTVIFGATDTAVPGTEVLHRLDRVCGGEPLKVTVLQADPAHTGAAHHAAAAGRR